MRAHDTVGLAGHRAARERLEADYRRIPAGQPVRLAKRTSNLFRPREGLDGPGWTSASSTTSSRSTPSGSSPTCRG